jgi:P-type Ca2+ transporter type 2C
MTRDVAKPRPAIAEAVAAPWFALSKEGCLARLGASSDGLTGQQVDERRAHWGRNELPRHRRASWPELFVSQFRSPLIYLLFGAAALSLWMGSAPMRCSSSRYSS